MRASQVLGRQQCRCPGRCGTKEADTEPQSSEHIRQAMECQVVVSAKNRNDGEKVVGELLQIPRKGKISPRR